LASITSGLSLDSNFYRMHSPSKTNVFS